MRDGAVGIVVALDTGLVTFPLERCFVKATSHGVHQELLPAPGSPRAEVCESHKTMKGA